MSFKIGFTAENENNEKNTLLKEENDKVPRKSTIVKKSVVDVFFRDRGLTCSYYNDAFDLKCGDIVYVDGKLEGLQGRVVNVCYTFKIKLSNYKRVIGVADTNVMGKFNLAGSHFITTDNNALNYEKIITWFKAPTLEEEFVYSSDDETFNLNVLSGITIDEKTADKGHEYYVENRVEYIELNNGKGRAIVKGTKPYEIEFNYNNGDISGLVCDCYCTGVCKHEFAAMLQLKETLDLIEEEYPTLNPNTYLAAVNKATFFDVVISAKRNGTFSTV